MKKGEKGSRRGVKKRKCMITTPPSPRIPIISLSLSLAGCPPSPSGYVPTRSQPYVRPAHKEASQPSLAEEGTRENQEGEKERGGARKYPTTKKKKRKKEAEPASNAGQSSPVQSSPLHAIHYYPLRLQPCEVLKSSPRRAITFFGFAFAPFSPCSPRRPETPDPKKWVERSCRAERAANKRKRKKRNHQKWKKSLPSFLMGETDRLLLLWCTPMV